GEMASGGFLRIEALGRVRRADVALKLHREKREALLEQRDMIDAQVAAHGVDEHELAFAAGAPLESVLTLGAGKAGELGIDLLGRGLGRRGLGSGGRWQRDSSESRESRANKKPQWIHVAHPSRLFSQQWHKPQGGQRREIFTPAAGKAPPADSMPRAC